MARWWGKHAYCQLALSHLWAWMDHFLLTDMFAYRDVSSGFPYWDATTFEQFREHYLSWNRCLRRTLIADDQHKIVLMLANVWQQSCAKHIYWTSIWLNSHVTLSFAVHRGFLLRLPIINHSLNSSLVNNRLSLWIVFFLLFARKMLWRFLCKYNVKDVDDDEKAVEKCKMRNSLNSTSQHWTAFCAL